MQTLLLGWIFIVVNYALFYLIGILVARWFGASHFGDYSIAVASLTLIGTAATLGLGRSGLNMLSVYKHRHEWDLYHGYIRQSLHLIITISFLLGLAFLGGFTLYEKYTSAEHSHPASILVIYFVPAAGIVFFLSQVLIANKSFIYSVIIQRFQLPLQVLLFLLFFKYFITEINVSYAILAYGISWVLCSISLIVVAYFSHDKKVFESRPKYETKLWLSNAYPFLVNTFVLNSIGAGTLVLLDYLHISESDIGVYAAASRTAVLLIVLMRQSDRYFLPLIAPEIHEGNTKEVNRILRSRLKTLGILSLFFFICMILFGRNILDLFGEGFDKGYHILLIFTAGMIIDILAGISTSILQITGKNKLSLKVSLIILLSNIFLNIILIPAWGLEAAVLGVNISIASINLFAVIYLARFHGIRVI